MDRRQAVAKLTEFLVDSIEKARARREAVLSPAIRSRVPRRHLCRDAARDAGGCATTARCPAATTSTSSMTAARPASRSTCSRNTSASMPTQKRELWDIVGRALCSNEVRDAFVRRLAPGAGAPLRPRLSRRRHVPDPDPDARRAEVQNHAAHRHQVEGHHGPVLSAAGRHDQAHRHDLP